MEDVTRIPISAGGGGGKKTEEVLYKKNTDPHLFRHIFSFFVDPMSEDVQSAQTITRIMMVDREWNEMIQKDFLFQGPLLLTQARVTVNTIPTISGKIEALEMIAIFRSSITGHAGHKGVVRGLLVEAKELAVADKSVDLNAHFLSIAGAQAESGMVEDAYKTANKITYDIWKPMAFSRIATKLTSIAVLEARDGKIDKVIATVDKITLVRHKHQSLLDIVEALTGTGDVKEAIEVVNAVEKTYSTFDYWKDQALSIIAKAQAKYSGNVEIAIETVNKMKTDKSKDEAFASIAQFYAESGDIGSAQVMADLITDHELSKDQALASIVKALVKQDKVVDAITIVSKITQDSKRMSALAFMVVSEAERGNIKGAIERLHKTFVENSKKKDITLASIVKIQADKGDIAGAKMTAGMILCGTDEMFEALTSIVQALAVSGHIEKAIEMVHRNSFDNHFKHKALASIALSQAERGNINGAIETARIFENKDAREGILASVVKVLADTGNVKSAIATVNMIFTAELKAQSQVEVVEALAQKGLIAGAKTVASMIQDRIKKIEALLEIYNIMNRQEREKRLARN
ncbi:MAG: hypothetical protein SP4CHLAM5_01510 [Chlamydiia bacterium]|nr:hypothetical protein [Chlamydiia bacterium]MCH9618026.1 hypothetical protein [Chlamydiia bacterium]MCH9623649.1 hypothetical protein [Chlamydiia bacterium]